LLVDSWRRRFDAELGLSSVLIVTTAPPGRSSDLDWSGGGAVANISPASSGSDGRRDQGEPRRGPRAGILDFLNAHFTPAVVTSSVYLSSLILLDWAPEKNKREAGLKSWAILYNKPFAILHFPFLIKLRGAVALFFSTTYNPTSPRHVRNPTFNHTSDTQKKNVKTSTSPTAIFNVWSDFYY